MLGQSWLQDDEEEEVPLCVEAAAVGVGCGTAACAGSVADSSAEDALPGLVQAEIKAVAPSSPIQLRNCRRAILVWAEGAFAAAVGLAYGVFVCMYW